MRLLGQHFLKNRQKLQEIASALNIKAGDIVIEIGPGHGELTDELLKTKAGRIIAVEKDRNLSERLKIKYAAEPRIKIITGDILKEFPNLTENHKLVGNIPYYITGHLLRIVGELENKPALTVLTVQKEVGERICAKPPQMNLLAASVQVWAEPEFIAHISKKEFQPAPEVDSVVIRLKTVKKNVLNIEKYYTLIKILFKQPRKTVLNNLLAAKLAGRAGLAAKLEKIKVNPYSRPQNLGLNQLKNLAEMLYN